MNQEWKGSPLEIAIRDRDWDELCNDFHKEPGEVTVEEMVSYLDGDTEYPILDTENLHEIIESIQEAWDVQSDTEKQGQLAIYAEQEGTYGPP